MIMYSNRSLGCDPSQRLRALRWADSLTTLLELGSLEAAMADACPEVAHAFGAAVMEAARGRVWAWRELLGGVRLPATVGVRRPEGFCDYGVTVESYRRAADRLWEALRPERATVIGIRTIGTTLSAVVAARLEERGCAMVRRFTVRPEGHPYHRVVRLDKGFAGEGAGWCVVVDEGPGRSGSSFAAVGQALEEAGVGAERIVLVPANDPQPEALCTEEGRAAWRRYARFQALYQRPGYLEGAAEFRQGSRLKYVWNEGPVRRVAKFAGIGPYGLGKLELARQLAEEGYTPRPRCLADGFLVSDWIEAEARPAVTAGFLEHAAEYVGWRSRLVVGEPGHSFEELVEMVEANEREAGAVGVGGGDLAWCREAVTGQPAVAMDGRMGLDKWLTDGRGYVKLDAVDHHDDHFYPGPQEIAWDVAGAMEEWGLDEAGAAYWLEVVGRRVGREGLEARVAFFRRVYRALHGCVGVTKLL